MTAAEWRHAFQTEHMRNFLGELSLHFLLLQTSVVHRVTWGTLVVIILMSLGRCPRECVLQENWQSCHGDFPRALKCSSTHSGHSFRVCWVDGSRKTWHLRAFYYLRSWEINERDLLNYVFMVLFPWRHFGEPSASCLLVWPPSEKAKECLCMSLYVQNIWGSMACLSYFSRQTHSLCLVLSYCVGWLAASSGDTPVSACLLRGGAIDGRQYT